MAYTTALYMLDYYGAREMAQLGAPENSLVTEDLLRATIEGGDLSAYTQEEKDAAVKAQARIDNAITNATMLINSYLSKRYELPLSSSIVAESMLQQVCCDLARYALYDDQAIDTVEKRYQQHMRWLRDLESGKAFLGQNDTQSSQSGTGVVRTNSSDFDWSDF